MGHGGIVGEELVHQIAGEDQCSGRMVGRDGRGQDLVDHGGVDIEVAPVLAVEQGGRNRIEQGMAVGAHQTER